MPIQLGSSFITNIFTANTIRSSQGFFISGSVIGLDSGSYANNANWTSSFSNTVTASVIGSPLASGSVGRWQFDGTNEYIELADNVTNEVPKTSTAGNEVFTFLFYGTIGSLTSRRALFGSTGGYFGEGDAILRTDTSPGSGKIHLDLRATGGSTNRFTINGSSGSLLNLAVVQTNNGSSSVYQDGLLVATSGSLVLGFNPWSASFGPSFIGFNSNVDALPYNGQLGGAYLYGREMSATEISQSAQAFYKGNTFGTTTVSSASAVFVGSQSVYPIAPISVLALVVGGGGAGGVGTAGGGGAGGMLTGSLSLYPSITYPVTVGSGGLSSAGPVGLGAATQSGNPGQTSSFSTLIAFGGGGGMAYEGTQNTSNGGSGGGASDTRLVQGSLTVGGSGSIGQGNNGAAGLFGIQIGQGGGGAGQTGQFGDQAVSPKRSGAGGSGSISTLRDGNSTFYAGGGGGAGYNTAIGGLGGPGGGGNGGGPSGGNGVTGSINTGGGGGGSNRNVNGTVNGVGAGGGSGIVVIAYLTSSASSSGFTSISGGIITDYTSGSLVYRSHTFLSSSNLVVN